VIDASVHGTSPYPSRYPDKRLEELKGFRLDRASYWAFERRFAAGKIGGLALFATPFVVALTSDGPFWGWWIGVAAAGVAVIAASLRLMYLAQPTHVPSGRPMTRYRNPSASRDLEILYVDDTSRSYFTVSYRSRDD
jgi:hypothetical protein